MIKIDQTQHRFDIDEEAALLYVIPPDADLQLLLNRFSVNGQLDKRLSDKNNQDPDLVRDFVMAAMKLFLVGWEGFIYTHNDEQVPFDLQDSTLRWVPFPCYGKFIVDVINPAVENIAKRIKQQAALLGNSEST